MRNPSRGGARRLVAFILSASLMTGASPVASAATIQLNNGEALDGVVALFNDEHISVRSRSGYRIIRRADVKLIVIERPDGSGVAGKLVGWKDGVYELSTTRGLFRIDDNGIDVAALDAAIREQNGAAPSGRVGAPDIRSGRIVAGDDLVTRAPADGQVRASVPLPPLSILENPPAAMRADPKPPEKPRAVEAAPKPPENPKPERRAAKPTPAPAQKPAEPEKPARNALETATAEPPAREEEAASVDQVSLLTLPEKPQAPAPAAAVPSDPAPSRQTRNLAPPLSPAERARRHAAYLAALGANGPAQDAESCALLTEMTAPPATEFGRREDREAVVLSLDGQGSLTAARRLAASFFSSNNSETNEREADPVISVEQTSPRLSLPMRINVTPERDRAHALAALDSGRSDLALVVEPPIGAVSAALSRALGDNTGGSSEQVDRLVGFDAIAFATPPDSPIRALSPDMLGAILSGRIDDWSMVTPSHVGAPVVYLPPEGSSALAAVLQYANVRRARPASVRYVELAEDRLAQAMADPNGLALVPWSVLRAANIENAAVALGQGSGAITLSLDTIRSAAYPLIVPVMLRLSRKPALPGARQFARFLSGAGGQRSIFAAGLAPVAACDPSTCPIQTQGLEKARMRLHADRFKTPLIETASGPVTARVERLSVDFESDSGFGARKALTAFLSDPRPGGALTVRAAARDGAEALARTRAEAMVLALRCGGRSVARAVFDPFATVPAGAESAISIIEE